MDVIVVFQNNSERKSENGLRFVRKYKNQAAFDKAVKPSYADIIGIGVGPETADVMLAHTSEIAIIISAIMKSQNLDGTLDFPALDRNLSGAFSLIKYNREVPARYPNRYEERLEKCELDLGLDTSADTEVNELLEYALSQCFDPYQKLHENFELWLNRKILSIKNIRLMNALS